MTCKFLTLIARDAHRAMSTVWRSNHYRRELTQSTYTWVTLPSANRRVAMHTSMRMHLASLRCGSRLLESVPGNELMDMAKKLLICLIHLAGFCWLTVTIEKISHIVTENSFGLLDFQLPRNLFSIDTNTNRGFFLDFYFDNNCPNNIFSGSWYHCERNSNPMKKKCFQSN